MRARFREHRCFREHRRFREHRFREHRRALTFGALALGAAAAVAAVTVSIATGDNARSTAVFARTSSLAASRGAVGPGLSLDGATVAQTRGGTKRTLGTLGGGDEVLAPLTGSLTPIGVITPDGAYAVYSSWRQLARIKPDARGQGLSTGDPVGVPSVRLFDVRSGKDALLATGAASPAVSGTGAVAYLAGDSTVLRQNVEYTGRIVVADSPNAKPRVWTSRPGRYLPYAWAGTTLLAYRGVPDSESADLYAFTGPDTSSLLAPNAYVIAVSPDGTEVIASVGTRMIERIRVSDGAVQDSLALDNGPSTLPHALMYSGDWRGDRIVANSDLGLVVLNVRGGLHVESQFATPSFPHGIAEPTFIDDTQVQGWADLPEPSPTARDVGEPAYDNALVDCDLATGRCTIGAANPARKWTRWITNPSR
jgi:hypothetical protein